MTADVFKPFDIFFEELGKEGHSLNAGDVIKIALIDSNWTPDTETDVTFSVIDEDELPTANGYTAGGQTVATTWDAETGTLTFNSANASWSVDTAALTARYAVLYNSSIATNNLIVYSLLDNSPADASADPTFDFVVTINASGIGTITVA